MTNSIHADPDIHMLLSEGANTFSEGEAGFYDVGMHATYDVRLIQPLIVALKKNEISNGCVGIGKFFKIMKWYGIDMTEMKISESSTVEVRHRQTKSGGRGGSCSKDGNLTKTMIGIKYRPVLRKVFDVNKELYM